jgi:hypothetical protein
MHLRTSTNALANRLRASWIEASVTKVGAKVEAVEIQRHREVGDKRAPANVIERYFPDAPVLPMLVGSRQPRRASL